MRFESASTGTGFHRILVVEDDEGLRTVVTKVLRGVSGGAHVAWVTTASEGISELEKSLTDRRASYDLVLCDLLLPNMELGTLIWKFRQENMPELPFAFMSSLEVPSYLGMLRGFGASPPLLHKPFRPDEARELVRFLLNGTTEDAACS